MRDADDLEKAVWDRLARGWFSEDDRRDALAHVATALRLREMTQGPEPVRSLRAPAVIYTFEYDVLDPVRVKASEDASDRPSRRAREHAQAE